MQDEVAICKRGRSPLVEEPGDLDDDPRGKRRALALVSPGLQKPYHPAASLSRHTNIPVPDVPLRVRRHRSRVRHPHPGDVARSGPKKDERHAGSQKALLTTAPDIHAFVWQPGFLQRMHSEWFFRVHGQNWTLDEALSYLDYFIVHDPAHTCQILQFSGGQFDEHEMCVVELFKARANSEHRHGTLALRLTDKETDVLQRAVAMFTPAFKAQNIDLEKSVVPRPDALGRICFRIHFKPEAVARLFASLHGVDVLLAWLAIPGVDDEKQRCIVLESVARRKRWRLSEPDIDQLFAALGDSVFTRAFRGQRARARQSILELCIRRNMTVIEARS